MSPAAPVLLTALSLLAGESTTPISQERDRAKIPDTYKWNLADLYPSDEAWKAAKQKLEGELPQAEAFRGTLDRSAQQLLAYLELDTKLSKEFARLFAYASMTSDQDTRVSKYVAMDQEMRQLGSTYNAKTAFFQPEVLKLDRAKIDAFLAQEKGLQVYRHYLDNVLRKKAHTGSEGEERILAHASLMSNTADSVYGMLANADFPYPTITLKDGSQVKIDLAAYTLHRASPVREDRVKVFASFFGKLNEFRRTYGATLAGQVKADMFNKEARHYGSCLEASLNEDNIPVDVYKALVTNVNRHLPTFHRYLKLRKRILGVPELHYYDLYAPLLADVDVDYPIDDAKKLVREAVKPLGADYQTVLDSAYHERWLDFLPNDGKRSGAYSSGEVHDVHPFMLLNYNGKYEDVSTLAHELGHTMHSYLANRAQPFVNARYSLFVAEVASTFNEALLVDQMLRATTDPKLKLSLLGSYLEGVKGTVFRQTQFAEFELAIHEVAEKGEALTGDRLNQIYRDITRRYYGHDQGVCVVDPEVEVEWAYIPHFYSPFYVYVYATSFTASTALSEPVLAGDAAATKRYLELLASGGSDYPVALLKKAGVDMTTEAPLELTMKKMERVMDEIEKLLPVIGK